MTNDILSFIEDKHKFLQTVLPQHYEKYKTVVDIGLPLMLVNKLITEAKEKLFNTKYSMTTSEFDVLMSLLCLNKQLTPTELYENMIFSSGGMTKLLKKLESKNLIKRIPSKEDKRSMYVVLTPEGTKLAIEAFDDIASMHMSLFAELENNEKTDMEKILKKMLVQLTTK
ncbi:MarR family winged helix-turn-helix transcriptional regulator [Arcobacter sp. FWKO B]|uniref:MarR family winged helix-turn-helix transcriptional regulator n=1 Tax=Arcobacter sp. FWKO B TaxID=2593672 RepID=UPI0018A3CFE1|nr:MarR family transcriptional regulator [Arcobacter sp. FWKO B]QOG13130.1 MarR family transcriptional regulator [Arcobacter sp. FWKO B]